MHTPVTASAPGSLMLLGEHAVLHGHRAIVCAVDARVKVTIQSRTDRMLRIDSALGTRAMPIEAIDNSPPFHFLAAVVSCFASCLQSGISISVDSTMPHELGLGSSAAVTVATMAAIEAGLDEAPQNHALQDACLEVIRQVQGIGAGADLAASVFGGAVRYRMEPREICVLDALPPLTVFYSGSKMPTPDVVRLVEERRAANRGHFDRLYYEADDLVGRAAQSIRDEDWPTLGALMDSGQDFMRSIGVSNDILEAIVIGLRQDKGIYGAKISGAGLGDCVIGIGEMQENECPYTRVAVAPSQRGVEIE